MAFWKEGFLRVFFPHPRFPWSRGATRPAALSLKPCQAVGKRLGCILVPFTMHHIDNFLVRPRIGSTWFYYFYLFSVSSMFDRTDMNQPFKHASRPKTHKMPCGISTWCREHLGKWFLASHGNHCGSCAVGVFAVSCGEMRFMSFNFGQTRDSNRLFFSYLDVLDALQFYPGVAHGPPWTWNFGNWLNSK